MEGNSLQQPPATAAGAEAGISLSTQGGTTTGAAHVPLYMERRVRVYPIQENELTTIGLLSHLVTGSAAVAGAVLGFMASILWDMATSSDEAKRTFGLPVVLVCVLVIIGCLVVGGFSISRRSKELKRIMDESRVTSGPGT